MKKLIIAFIFAAASLFAIPGEELLDKNEQVILKLDQDALVIKVDEDGTEYLDPIMYDLIVITYKSYFMSVNLLPTLKITNTARRKEALSNAWEYYSKWCVGASYDKVMGNSIKLRQNNPYEKQVKQYVEVLKHIRTQISVLKTYSAVDDFEMSNGKDTRKYKNRITPEHRIMFVEANEQGVEKAKSLIKLFIKLGYIKSIELLDSPSPF